MSFRRISNIDHSVNESYNTTRVSSGLSMISTPSNNIRKLQHQNEELQKPARLPGNLISKSKNPHLKPKKLSNVNLVKNKLLNLQKLLKIYKKLSTEEVDPSFSKNFILRKPIGLNTYDYSIYRGYDGYEGIAPTVKESQIKAWESAEKISNNLIFDNDSDLSDDDEKEIDDQIISSIPGFNNEELDIIISRFDSQQQLKYETNYKEQEEDEKEILWNYRQQQQINHNKMFSQYSSLNSKRKVQIAQKKDFFNKMFGNSNTLNKEYITNNTTYSSIDNVLNTSKSFREDKEEITQLLNEDKQFHLLLEETKNNLMKHQRVLVDEFNVVSKRRDFDNDKYVSLIKAKLTKLYGGSEVDTNDEFNGFALGYLRRCLKYDDDNDM